MSNIAINPIQFSYVVNLQLAWASTTTLTVAAGAARDSTNTNDLILGAPVTINSAVNGANGLDTGSLANTTWYAVYIIGSSTNSTVTAALLSTSATAPTLPKGYDIFRRIGWVITDGSANIIVFSAYGSGNDRKYFLDTVVTVLNAAGNTAYTDVSLTGSVPPSSSLVILNWKFVPATAGNTALLRTKGSTATANQQLTGSVAAQPNGGQVFINANTSQVIQYKTTSGSDALTLYVAGFEEYL